MKVLATICARGGSKGIPGKNIRLLGGKPMIVYTIEVARRCKAIERVIVSTDDTEIARIARASGAEIPFMRPKELAEDNTPTLPVVRHAVEFLEREQNYTADIVVVLQPTAPLRKTYHIDEALNLLINNPGADSIVSVMEVPHQYNPYFVMKIEDDLLKFYNEDAIKYTRRQSLPKAYSRNGAIYAFRLETLNKKNSLYGDTCLPYVMSFEESANIDTMYDLMMAEIFLRNR